MAIIAQALDANGYARAWRRLAGLPTRPPLRGRRRLRWLRSLERAITDDARRTVALLERQGWDGADAAVAYRTWLVELVDTAVAEREDRGR